MSGADRPRHCDLRRIVADYAGGAGLSTAQIAVALNAEGVSVPRAAEVSAGGPPSGHNGFKLATEPGDPGRWTAAAVAQVLAAPKAVTTNNWPSARATLGSEYTTTITVA